MVEVVDLWKRAAHIFGIAIFRLKLLQQAVMRFDELAEIHARNNTVWIQNKIYGTAAQGLRQPSVIRES